MKKKNSSRVLHWLIYNQCVPGIRFKLKPESIALPLSSTSSSMLHPSLFQFDFDTCVLSAFIFSTSEWCSLQHSATMLHPQAHCWLVCWGFIFPPEQASYLSWLLFLKEEFHSWSIHSTAPDIGSRWPTVCCETWESKFKKKKILSRFWNAVLRCWEEAFQRGFFFFIMLAIAFVYRTLEVRVKTCLTNWSAQS